MEKIHFAANVRLMGAKWASMRSIVRLFAVAENFEWPCSLERQPIESSSIRIYTSNTFDYLLIDACRVPLASHRWLINVRLNVQFRITRRWIRSVPLVLYQISLPLPVSIDFLLPVSGWLWPLDILFGYTLDIYIFWEISINLISTRFLIDFRAWKEIEEILKRIFFKEEKNRERYSLRD